MKKSILLFLMITALLGSFLTGCKPKAEEESASVDSLVEGSTNQKNPEKLPEEGSNSETEKPSVNTNDQHQTTPEDQKDPPSADEPATTPGDDQESPNDPSSKEETPVINEVSLTNLQTPGASFPVSAGDTIWFGPMDILTEEFLTFADASGNQTKIGKNNVTESDSFSGGYRIYSYKATAAGTVIVNPPQAYENRFLISKNQEMTVALYHHHWDQVAGINLYDGVLEQSRQTINWKGKVSSSSEYHLSHGISVKEGDTLTIGPINSEQVVQGYGFDAKGNATTLINGSNMANNGSFPQGMQIYTYTVPAGVYAVQFNVPDAMKNKVMITKNKVFSIAEYQNTTGVNAATVGDPLKGSDGLFAGDSINHGLTSRDEEGLAWAGRIARDTGLISTNVGKSGYHYAHISSNYGPISDLLEANKKNDFDYVVLQGGYNDVSKKVKLGKISNSYNPDTFDTSTFAGGLEYTIYNTIKYHGDTAAIGYIVTFRVPKAGGAEAEYYDLAKKICEKWGITFLDLYNNEKLNADLKYDTNEHTNDNLHPDASGYELITPYVTEYMRTMTPCSQEILEEVLG